MMLFELLVSLISLASSHSTEQRNEKKLQQLELKLRVNQNITGMSEEQYQMLWDKAMESLKRQEFQRI